MADQPIPEYRVLLTVDIEDYGSRTDGQQRTLQSALTQTLDQAADAADLKRESWLKQSGGDGFIAVLPTGTDVTRLMDGFVRALDAGLGWYNRSREEEEWTPMRLRLAVHAGPIHLDGAAGWPGQHVVLPARLRDSQPVRAALAATPGADLAVIVSAEVYRDYVAQGPGNPRPTEFLSVRVAEKKQNYVAYLYLPRFAVHEIAELARFAIASDEPTATTDDSQGSGDPGRDRSPRTMGLGSRPVAGRDVIGSIDQRASGGGSIHYSAGDSFGAPQDRGRHER